MRWLPVADGPRRGDRRDRPVSGLWRRALRPAARPEVSSASRRTVMVSGCPTITDRGARPPAAGSKHSRECPRRQHSGNRRENPSRTSRDEMQKKIRKVPRPRALPDRLPLEVHSSRTFGSTFSPGCRRSGPPIRDGRAHAPHPRIPKLRRGHRTARIPECAAKLARCRRCDQIAAMRSVRERTPTHRAEDAACAVDSCFPNRRKKSAPAPSRRVFMRGTPAQAGTRVAAAPG
jgi:hypothetical protein